MQGISSLAECTLTFFRRTAPWSQSVSKTPRELFSYCNTVAGACFGLSRPHPIILPNFISYFEFLPGLGFFWHPARTHTLCVEIDLFQSKVAVQR
jgi:hypothetical protein